MRLKTFPWFPFLFINNSDLPPKLVESCVGTTSKREVRAQSTLFGFVVFPCLLEKIEGKRRRGRKRMRWLDSITNSVDMDLLMLGKIEGGRRRG